MIKYAFFAFFALVMITSSDPFFGTVFSLKPIPAEEESDVRELPWSRSETSAYFLEDRENRVNEVFKIKEYYRPMVQFWFHIYTKFDSGQVVIHDKSNMELIYKVLDFSSLYNKGLPRNTVYVLQQKITEERIKEIKDVLLNLKQDPFLLNESTKSLFQILNRNGVTPPISRQDRIRFFGDLHANLRSQTGQKNFIKDGIIRSLPYQKFLSDYFSKRKLPKELLAIPFLESSFNPRAHSKANALGVWQFMPLIASYYVPKKETNLDYRSNVGVASLSAAFLMAENIMILKSWDLAVTAYNSGTKHLVQTKRELGNPNVQLEDIIVNSDSKHFGFASKNFYSEFLALVHTLAYENEIFADIHEHDRPDVNHPLKFYLLKCASKLDKVLSEHELDDAIFHNHQIQDFKATQSRGLILTTKSDLSEKYFYRIQENVLLKTKPKDWEIPKGYSCSTK
jgi:membrane-bound lytic murein transglycosylase D